MIGAKTTVKKLSVPALFVTSLLPALIMMLSIGVTMVVPFSSVIDRFGVLAGVSGIVLLVYLVSLIFTLAIAVINYFLTYFTSG